MTALEPSTGGATDHRSKRRAYVLMLGGVALLLVVLTVRRFGTHPFERLVFPILAIYATVLLVLLLTRRLTPRAAEPWLLVPPVLVLVGYLVVWRFSPDVVSAELVDLVLTSLWLWVCFPLAFLAYGTRRGLIVSVTLVIVYAALLGPPIVRGEVVGGNDGPLATIVVNLVAIFGVSIVLLGVLASRYEQLTAVRRQAARFAAEAGTDPLTGLANRRRLDDEFDRLIAQARRQDHPLSLLIVDLDHFKAVNDTHGHDVGDTVLREVARRLRSSVRHGDLLGRWGGEEFLVVAPYADHAAALELAERCRADLGGRPFASVGTITASIGVATLAAEDEDRRALQRRADHALYTAKRGGRDQVVGEPPVASVSG